MLLPCEWVAVLQLLQPLCWLLPFLLLTAMESSSPPLQVSLDTMLSTVCIAHCGSSWIAILVTVCVSGLGWKLARCEAATSIVKSGNNHD